MSNFEIADRVVASRPRISIRRMIIMETGTYTRQVNRPMRVTMDSKALDNLGNQIKKTGAQTFSASLLNAAGSRFIEPDMYSSSDVDIVNGWGERRCRFILEVDIEKPGASRMTNFYQGYSDRLEETLSGELADDTEYIINSFMSSTVGQRGIPRLRQHSQIFSGDFSRDEIYSIRPHDIGIGIQSNLMRKAFADDNHTRFDETRLKPLSEAVSSERRNNIPTNYLTKILKSHYAAQTISDFGADQLNIADSMCMQLQERELTEDDFLRQLSYMVGHGSRNFRSVKFILKDLYRMDPDFHPDQVEYRRVGRAGRARMSTAHDGADWTENSAEAMWATVLANAVPALMIETMFNKIDFTIHNLGVGGYVDLEINPETFRLIGDVRVSEVLNKFKFLLETEVLSDLSLRNEILYDIRCQFDLGLEAIIDISLHESRSKVRFVAPIFADAIMSPTYTVTSDSVDQLLGDMESLLDRLPDLSSKPSSPRIITNLGGI